MLKWTVVIHRVDRRLGAAVVAADPEARWDQATSHRAKPVSATEGQYGSVFSIT